MGKPGKGISFLVLLPIINLQYDVKAKHFFLFLWKKRAFKIYILDPFGNVTIPDFQMQTNSVICSNKLTG